MCAFTYFLMIEDIIYKSDDVILQLVEKDCILDSSIHFFSTFHARTRSVVLECGSLETILAEVG